MTEQYAQPNINMQGGAGSFVATVAAPDATLVGSGDQTLSVDATAAASQVNLPLASEAGPNAKITVIKADAANPVTVAAQGADALNAAAGVVNPLAAQFDSLTFVSNGVDAWTAIGGTV